MRVKAYVTPAVLRWARETAGFSVADVVSKLNLNTITTATVEAWEEGTEHPTYSQFKRLAKFYRRPAALFYFPEPPKESTIEQDFRAVPPKVAKEIPTNIRYLLRQAKARQLDLEELHDGVTETAAIIDVRKQGWKSVMELAQRIRNRIGVSTQDQCGWKDSRDAFDNWRVAVEELGVWVFKEAFKNEDYCGFCVYDEKFPIIYINNSQAPQRQIFTLFHELGHLLINKAGVDFRAEPVFEGVYWQDEVFCNAFAGEFLVLETELGYTSLPEDGELEDLAKKYKVSFEVILRKFLDKRLISSEDYRSTIDRREQEF